MKQGADAIPLPAAPYFGRQDEEESLAALLPTCRALTVTGAGGCGKTSIAARVAAAASPRYDDGVVWVDLGPITHPGMVGKAVLAALDVADRPHPDQHQWIAAALRERQLLLVLDNCEHLLDPCAEIVQTVLRSAPGVTVLSTSHQGLGVQGEIHYPLGPLVVPPVDASSQEVGGSPAGALFVDRAARSRPGFALTDDNTAAVADICRRLDGIPLALELAAARVRLLTPAQIAAGLTDRFALLTGGLRTALPRQRTLEASLAWSYELLDPRERAALSALCAFAGTFDLEAALKVLGGAEATGLELLTHLVDRSLVQVHEHPGGSRYRLLESIRAYTLIRADGDATGARQRHAQHYLASTERRAFALFGPDLDATLQAMDDDVDNVRTAMEFCVAVGDLETALRLAGAAWAYWFVRARHDEALVRLRGLLDAAPDADPVLRYRVLVALMLLSLTSDARGGRELAVEAVRLADALDSDALRAQAHAYQGQFSLHLGDQDGLAHLELSLDLARQADDPGQIARSQQWLGTALTVQGRTGEGTALLEASLDLCRTSGNVLQLGYALVWRAYAATQTGHLSKGRAFAQEAVEVLSARRERGMSAVSLVQLSLLDALQGDVSGAWAHLDRARSLSSYVVSPLVEAQEQVMRAQLHLIVGELPEALAAAQASRRLGAVAGNPYAVASFPLLVTGLAELGLGNLDRARAVLQEGLTEAQVVPHLRSRLLQGLAEVAAQDGADDPLELSYEALQLALASGLRLEQVDGLELLAHLLVDDDPALAHRLLSATTQARSDLSYHLLLHPQRHENLLRRARPERYDVDAAVPPLPLADAAALALRGRGPRARPATGWASLTPTELAVAAQVGQGRSNPEIAATLFMSRHTVKAHLAHIYAKLDLTNRTQLSALVTRADQPGGPQA